LFHQAEVLELVPFLLQSPEAVSRGDGQVDLDDPLQPGEGFL